MKINNKGFTLIEVMVSLVVVSLFTMAFILTVGTAYKYFNAATELKNTSDTMFDEIQDEDLNSRGANTKGTYASSTVELTGFKKGEKTEIVIESQIKKVSGSNNTGEKVSYSRYYNPTGMKQTVITTPWKYTIADKLRVIDDSIIKSFDPYQIIYYKKGDYYKLDDNTFVKMAGTFWYTTGATNDSYVRKVTYNKEKGQYEFGTNTSDTYYIKKYVPKYGNNIGNENKIFKIGDSGALAIYYPSDSNRWKIMVLPGHCVYAKTHSGNKQDGILFADYENLTDDEYDGISYYKTNDILKKQGKYYLITGTTGNSNGAKISDSAGLDKTDTTKPFTYKCDRFTMKSLTETEYENLKEQWEKSSANT